MLSIKQKKMKIWNPENNNNNNKYKSYLSMNEPTASKINFSIGTLIFFLYYLG